MLIVTAGRKELGEAISKASQGLPARPSSPAMAGIFLQAHAIDGPGIYLTATDGQMTFTASVKAEIHTGGNVLLPGRMLAEVSKYFTGDSVTIDYQGGPTAELIFGRSRVQLSASDGRLFPKWDAFSAQPRILLDAAGFAAAVRKVAPAASGKANPVLESVLISLKPDGMRLVGTDSYQMAIAFRPANEEGPDSHVLVPLAAITRFARTLEEGTVSLGWNEKVVAMSTPELRVLSRQVSGKYVEWERVLGSLPPACGITCDTAEMTAAVRMAALTAGEDGRIKLDLSHEGALVSAAGHEGGSQSYVALSNPPGIEDDFSVLLGAQNLLDGLAACGQVADLAYTAPLKPFVMRGGDVTFMIQPRREQTGEK